MGGENRGGGGGIVWLISNEHVGIGWSPSYIVSYKSKQSRFFSTDKLSQYFCTLKFMAFRSGAYLFFIFSYGTYRSKLNDKKKIVDCAVSTVLYIR